MTIPQQVYTVEEFEAFVDLPENRDRIFELINGEVVEKMPSNPRASEIGYNLGFYIKLHLHQNGLGGHVTGEAGGYMVFGERYAPDVAYISDEKQIELAEKGYNPNPPDLAVEVDFPSTYESQRKLRIKITDYLAAGTTVWVLLPEIPEIEIHEPGKPFKKVVLGQYLEGGDVLPGFKVLVDLIFKKSS